MPTPPAAAPEETLRRGQAHESRGECSDALACYDEVLARLRESSALDLETRRVRGVAWMNRGNVLQKFADETRLDRAVSAYDQAIEIFNTLPVATNAAHRNHLGAAWLNRGHALIAANETREATVSFKRALALLQQLPLGENTAYRLNLVGAWTNLAHVQLCISPASARTSAQAALTLLSDIESAHLAFGEMSLQARRALVTALGELLVSAESVGQSTAAFAAEASDAIDEGLALARRWEERGFNELRPLAHRIFHLGAQLYRMHQPHFLVEFLEENIDPAQAGAVFAHDENFRATGLQALSLALADLSRPRLLVAGERRTEQLLVTVRQLRAARDQFTAAAPEKPSP